MSETLLALASGGRRPPAGCAFVKGLVRAKCREDERGRGLTYMVVVERFVDHEWTSCVLCVFIMKQLSVLGDLTPQ